MNNRNSLTFPLASLVHSFEESATLALSGKAKKLASEGRDIVNFGAGEPDFNTPEPIIEAALRAAKAGQTKYTAVGGTPSLRKALSQRLTDDYQLPFSPEEIVLSTGGKQAIFHFLQSVLDREDEVLILAPYWVSFPEMVKIVGGKPVIVHPSDGKRVKAEDLEAAITPKTKLLILNSPSNPSGEVFSREELQSFLRVIESHPIYVLSDDTYYALVYEPATFVSVLKINSSFKNRTCVIGSASKSYAMTGWRIGWAVAPLPIVEAMTKLQGQVTSNPSSISQAALEAAVKDYYSVAKTFRTSFEKRRDLMMGLFNDLGITYKKPDGAFYILADLRMVEKRCTVERFCVELLDDYGVCVIPGLPFGAPGFARFSYATSEDRIAEGLKRLQKALGKSS